MILGRYIPAGAVDLVHQLVIKHKVALVIARRRRSKLGDFRPGNDHKPSRITVNHDLNPYTFLFTFLHELAHQLVFEKHRKHVSPHGKEWQNEFRKLLELFNDPGIFPQEILNHVLGTEKRIFASSSSDTELTRMLKSYDTSQQVFMLEQIPVGSHFSLPDGRLFKKMHRRRKNYLCHCVTNGKKYIFNPLAGVIPVSHL